MFLLGFAAGFHLHQASRMILSSPRLVSCVGLTLILTIAGILFAELYRGYATSSGPLLQLVLSGILPVGYLLCQKREVVVATAAETKVSLFPFTVLISIIGLVFAYFYSTVVLNRLSADNLPSLYGWSYVFYFVALLTWVILIVERDLLRLWVVFFSLFGCGVAVALAALMLHRSPLLPLILFSISAAGLDYLFWLCFADISVRKGDSWYFFIGLFTYWIIVEIATFLGSRAHVAEFAEMWAVVGFALIFLAIALFSGTTILRSGKAQVQRAEQTNEIITKKVSGFMKRLTVTEQRVYNMMVRGKSNREIADELSVSTNTVKFHVRNILQKAEVKNRIELLAKPKDTLDI